jgi:signal peptidase I
LLLEGQLFRQLLTAKLRVFVTSTTEQSESGNAGTNLHQSSSKSSSEWRDYGAFLLKLALFVFILRSFIVSPFNIPSESMQPRLLIGDYLLVAKWPYGYSKYSMPFSLPIIPGRIFASQPERGDVVVFKAPPTLKDDYIKRVIGLPGDVIQMRGGILEINGVAVKKERIADLVIPVSDNMKDAAALDGSPFPCWRPDFEERAKAGGTQCRYPRYTETLPGGKTYDILDLDSGLPGDDTEAFVVGEGQLFLMGDNRDRSADSRFPADGKAIGIVPQEYLVGRALVSVFSTDGSARLLLPWTWFSAARPERIGQGF